VVHGTGVIPEVGRYRPENDSFGKTLSALSCVFCLILFLGSIAACSSNGDGDFIADTYFAQAQQLRRAGWFTSAIEEYQTAWDTYSSADIDSPSSRKCLEWIEKLQVVKLEFPLDYEQAVQSIDAFLQGKSSATPLSERNACRDEFLNSEKIERLFYDGEFRYQGENDLIHNFIHRDWKLTNSLGVFGKTTMPEDYNGVFEIIDELAANLPAEEGNQILFFNPIEMQFAWNIKLPANEIPDTGNIELWFPLAINDSFQDGIEIIQVTPQEYQKTVSVDAIGNIYFCIPAAEIPDGLEVNVVFKWRRYEHRVYFDEDRIESTYLFDPVNYVFSFPSIDPDFISKYTASSNNCVVSEQIKEKAIQLIDGYLFSSNKTTLNPYECAKVFYDFIFDRISYVHVPWTAVDILQNREAWDGVGYPYDGLEDDLETINNRRKIGVPASEYVLNRYYGDCGADAAFFTALCRAVGIPATSMGGYQMLRGWGDPSSHFWSAFYLPYYEWVLLDPSVGAVSAYLYQYGEFAGDYDRLQQRKAFFFGGLDNLRLDIQDELDLIPNPPPSQYCGFTLAFQNPRVVIEERVPQSEPFLGIVLSNLTRSVSPCDF
jgi:hypothetical protein